MIRKFGANTFSWFKRTGLLKKIVRWIGYGVILSWLPYGLMLTFNWIVGYEVEVLTKLPDYLLIAFAIAVNALHNETDQSKKLHKTIRDIFKVFSVCSLFACIILYVGLFNDGFISPLITTRLKENYDKVLWLHRGTTVVLITNIVFGIIIEISDAITKANTKKVIGQQEY